MHIHSLERTSIRVLLVLFSLSLQLSCGPETLPRSVATCDASVSFHTNHLEHWPKGKIVRIALAVSKPGKTSLVNGKGGPNEQYGWHNFPIVESAAIAGYYEALLQIAGWKTPQDFVCKDGTIHFYGISSIGAGSNDPQVQVAGTTHPEVIRFVQLEVYKD